MPYSVQIKESARKELETIPRKAQRQIVGALSSLANDPIPRGARKLTGATNFYRIRSGDYRVVYEIASKKLIVYVIKIGHRKDVYRRI